MTLFFADLPDETIHGAARYLSAASLLRFASTSKRFASMDTSELWRGLSIRLVAPYPRYRLSLKEQTTSWIEWYRSMEREISRTQITHADLTTLKVIT